MQVLTTLLLTMTTLLLLSNAVKASPILPMDGYETSVQELRDLPVEEHKQLKRICGMSWFGCESRKGVKKKSSLYHFICFVVVVVVVVVVV